MRVSKAIASLEQLIVDINDPERIDDAWRLKAVSFAKEYFGDESPEYYQVRAIDLKYYVREDDTIDDLERKKSAANKQAKGKLQACIDILKTNGFPKKPKHNYLQNFGNDALITSFLAVASTLFGAGVFIGKLYNERKTDSCEKELSATRDSLSLFRNSSNIPNKIPDSSSDMHYKDSIKKDGN